MSDHKAPMRVLFPQTVSEAINMASNEPDSIYLAGGTHVFDMDLMDNYAHFPPVVISLANIDELTQMNRSDKAFVIGSRVTIDKLAQITKLHLPTSLQNAISMMGNWPLRCQATIGGHLANKNRIGDLTPLLQLLDTKIEMRYQKKKRGKIISSRFTRKISLTGLREQKDMLPRSMLVTRIRIPVKPWDINQYSKIHINEDPNRILICCILARVDQSTITDFRMAMTDTHTDIKRNSELESTIAGWKIPVSKKEQTILEEGIAEMTKEWSDDSPEKKIALKQVNRFFAKAFI